MPDHRRTLALAILAPAAITAAAPVSASRTPAAEQGVSVRILEVGDRGRIDPDYPVNVRAAVAVHERFDGAFVVELSTTTPGTGAAWDPWALDHATRVRFSLEDGETRVLTAHLPAVGRPSTWGDSADLRWRVEDLRARTRVEGRASGSFAAPRGRTLYLTEAALPSADLSRAPALAWEEVQPYGEYQSCVVSGLDFAAMRVGQRQALLDRVALGAVLVLTAPLGSPGDVDVRLASPEAIVWRDGQGHEAREVRWHQGYLRTVDRAIERLAPDGAGRLPAVARLLTSPHPAGAVGLEDVPFRVGLHDWLWDEHLSGPAPLATARTVSALGLVFASVVLAAAHWASRPRRAAPALPIALGATVLALAPLAGYLGLRRTSSGNCDATWDLVWHDPAAALQSRWAHAIAGGGGGTEDPALQVPSSPRALWSFERPGDGGRSLRVDQGLDGVLTLTIGRRGLTVSRELLFNRGEVAPDDPAWDVEAVAAKSGRPGGRLRARRALQQLALVGPEGGAWFGALRPGETVDLAQAAWRVPSPEQMWGRAAASPISRTLARLFFAARSRDAPLYVAASEEGPATVRVIAGSLSPRPRVVHVQALRIHGPQAAVRVSGAPARRDGERLLIQVPELLWQSMSARRLVVVPEFQMLDRSVPVAVGPVEDGLRVLSFRVQGMARPDDAVLCRWEPSPHGAP